MTGTTKQDIAAAKNRIAANIQTLLQPVEMICRGDKPDNVPPELLELLNRMWRDDFLAETPASYVYLPGEDTSDEALRRNKGQTWVHPISQELVTRKQIIDSAAHKDGVFNYKILGLDPHFRRLSRTGNFDANDPVEQCEDARALILPRGDMHSLRQALHILHAKMTDDARAHETALIIQNTHNEFWNPLFEAVGLTPNGSVMLDNGIYVTQYPGGNETADETGTSTLHVLKTLPNMGAQPARDRLDATIQPGDILYVASGSPHKSREISEIFSDMRGRVHVYSLNSAIDVKPQEAEEASCSLEGNNMEKMQSVLERVRNDIGYDKFAAELCKNGTRPENVWIVFDDRGLEFADPRIVHTKAFDPVRSVLNPYPLKRGPGAELAWVLKTVSRTRFFEEMLAGAKQEIEGRGDVMPVDTSVIDTACHVSVRLDWLKDHDMRYIATMAKVHSVARTYATPLVDANFKPIKALQTDHYLVPKAFISNGELRSKAEIANYIRSHSEIAGSLRAFGELTNIGAHSRNLSGFSYEFNAASGGGQTYHLASLHTFFPDIYGHGSRKMSRIITHPFKMMSGNSGRYSLAQFRKAVPMTDDDRAGEQHRDRVKTALNRMRALYNEADGFILTEDNPRLENFSGIKWLKTLFYFSLLVGKQVDDRAIKAKFFGHLRNDGRTARGLETADTDSWREQEHIFNHLAQTPLLMNRQEDLMDVYRSGVSLRRGIKTFNTSYIRPKVTEKAAVNKDDRTAMPDDLYRVTVYCSASLGSETDACKNAHAFAYGLAENGFALINGGGKEGLMVATSEGVHAARRAYRKIGRTIARNHVTSYQCHDTYEREGGWHKDNDDAMIFATIEERMANLMNTDAEILMAGGAGSIQEIAASILMRQWGLVPVVNRPLVIVNEQIDGIRVFNPLLDMMSNEEMIRLNIHVVENQERAMDIIMQSRADMAAAKPGQIYVPHNDNDPVNDWNCYTRPAFGLA